MSGLPNGVPSGKSPSRGRVVEGLRGGRVEDDGSRAKRRRTPCIYVRTKRQRRGGAGHEERDGQIREVRGSGRVTEVLRKS